MVLKAIEILKWRAALELLLLSACHRDESSRATPPLLNTVELLLLSRESTAWYTIAILIVHQPVEHITGASTLEGNRRRPETVWIFLSDSVALRMDGWLTVALPQSP